MLANYRHAVIILSKFGFRPDDVSNMNHIEIAAWIDSYLVSQGVKNNAHQDDENTTTYIFNRRQKKGT